MEKKKDRIFILKGNRSPLTYSLPSVDKPKNRLLYFDEKANRNRALRYARNQKSPFIDEQDDHVVLEAIVFEDGQLIVAPNQPELIKFLEIHPLRNQVFEEFDPEKHAEERERYLDLANDAAIKVREMKPEEMKAMLDELSDMGTSDLSVAELRYSAKKFAQDYPEAILEYLSGGFETEDGILIEAMRAIDDKYVSVRDKGTKMHYNLKDNKSQLMIIPHNVKPLKALSDWLKTDEGNEFYEHLKKEFEESED